MKLSRIHVGVRRLVRVRGRGSRGRCVASGRPLRRQGDRRRRPDGLQGQRTSKHWLNCRPRANKKIFAELAEQGENHPRYKSIASGWRSTAVQGWDGKTVDAPRYKDDQAWVPFGKLPDGRMVVVVLKREGKVWAFEDVNGKDKAAVEKESQTPAKD